MPLYRRIPKRGFKCRNSKEIVTVNLGALEVFEDGATVDIDMPDLLDLAPGRRIVRQFHGFIELTQAHGNCRLLMLWHSPNRGFHQGKEDASKNLIQVALDENNSITHDFIGKFGSASVLLKRAPDHGNCRLLMLWHSPNRGFHQCYS